MSLYGLPQPAKIPDLMDYVHPHIQYAFQQRLQSTQVANQSQQEVQKALVDRAFAQPSFYQVHPVSNKFREHSALIEFPALSQHMKGQTYQPEIKLPEPVAVGVTQAQTGGSRYGVMPINRFQDGAYKGLQPTGSMQQQGPHTWWV